MNLQVLGLIALSSVFTVTEAVKFLLDSGSDHYSTRGRCVIHRIPGHSLVTGQFMATPAPNTRVSAYVYDPNGNQPFSKADLTGESRFSFRSLDSPTEYEFCLRLSARTGYGPPTGNPLVPVQVEVTHTHDLFDEKKVQETKLKPIENEFVAMEQVIRGIADEANNFLRTEAEHRRTNESTFDMLKYFSVVSFLALIGLTAYQVLYMKRYFKSKKLI